jgi:hypothetical protein
VDQRENQVQLFGAIVWTFLLLPLRRTAVYDPVELSIAPLYIHQTATSDAAREYLEEGYTGEFGGLVLLPLPA